MQPPGRQDMTSVTKMQTGWWRKAFPIAPLRRLFPSMLNDLVSDMLAPRRAAEVIVADPLVVFADGLVSSQEDLITLSQAVRPQVLRIRGTVISAKQRGGGTKWIVPLEVQLTTAPDEILRMFCEAHGLRCAMAGEVMPTVEEIERHVGIIVYALKQRNRVKIGLRKCLDAVRVLRRAMDKFVARRRARHAVHAQAVKELLEARRDVIVRRMHDRLDRQRHAKKDHRHLRPAPISEEERDALLRTGMPSPAQIRAGVVHGLVECFKLFHEEWKAWRQANGARVAAIRKAALDRYGSTLSLAELLHRANIPPRPLYREVFQAKDCILQVKQLSEEAAHAAAVQHRQDAIESVRVRIRSIVATSDDAPGNPHAYHPATPTAASSALLGRTASLRRPSSLVVFNTSTADLPGRLAARTAEPACDAPSQPDPFDLFLQYSVVRPQYEMQPRGFDLDPSRPQEWLRGCPRSPLLSPSKPTKATAPKELPLSVVAVDPPTPATSPSATEHQVIPSEHHTASRGSIGSRELARRLVSPPRTAPTSAAAVWLQRLPVIVGLPFSVSIPMGASDFPVPSPPRSQGRRQVCLPRVSRLVASDADPRVNAAISSLIDGEKRQARLFRQQRIYGFVVSPPHSTFKQRK